MNEKGLRLAMMIVREIADGLLYGMGERGERG